MPYALNQGVRIHYQVEGTGPPLVLHHGFSGSLQDWRDWGYVEALRSDWQLVLIDARGHGASDKPHDPAAYELSVRVADIIAVLDGESIQKAGFFGYSMGGWIGFGVGKYAPERIDSMIIGGAHPFARSMEPFRQLLRDGIERFAERLGELVGSLPPAFRQRIVMNDAQALLALQQDRPDLAEMLPTMTMPCLLFVGEADPIYLSVQECAQQMPGATFVSLPRLNHIDAYLQSDLVLPHITISEHVNRLFWTRSAVEVTDQLFEHRFDAGRLARPCRRIAPVGRPPERLL